MKSIEQNGSIIYYDDYKIEENKELKDFLESSYLKEIINSFEEKIIVVLGGDGTMLRAIKENYDKKMPFLGINFGHKGFLLNGKDYIKPNLSYIERKYPLLEIELQSEGIVKKAIAVNEIDIRSGNGKMVSLDISLSKNQVINIEGDGIVVTTPAGSTGYNSSLGGPIIPHTLNAFAITPKAPWKPKLQAPVLINDNQLIEIKNVGRKNMCEIYFDGKEFLKTKENNYFDVTIKKSEIGIRLIIASEYLDIWDNKVLSEQGFQKK
ncbi:MAG: NAD(+)/NADH kinase [Candidatus Gracilibacteria bacterium]|nr:NAD(+)/NADH kinase [Candidatus Gracilibacteria bacterium]